MLVDRFGNPITSVATRESVAAIQLTGGRPPDVGFAATIPADWRRGLPHNWQTTDLRAEGRYGITREAARRVCRALFFTNGLFKMSVEIAAAFLVGDALRYDSLADKGLQIIMEEFWQANQLGELFAQRTIIEWFLDGELAFVFPEGDIDAPAKISMLDVDNSGFFVEADVSRGGAAGNMVTAVGWRGRLGQPDRSWREGRFCWAANDALWNDPRGWPLALPAAEAAMAYIAMLNMRLNVHHMQQRILAVYNALFDENALGPNGQPDGGLYAYQMKTAAFKQLPDQGGVLSIITKPGYTRPDGTRVDGVSEDLRFLSPAQGAADAAQDMRQILRLVGLAIGALPEHYLGEGGNANRSTAAEMGLPAVRIANRRQAALSGLFNRLLRTEAARRLGPEARFRVSKGSRRRVGIDQLEFPVVFPEVREESFEQVIRRAEMALQQGLISRQTATSDLGYDSALEAERLASQPASQPALFPDLVKSKGGSNGKKDN